MKVWVMPHAAERFAERVRPGLGRREASVELARLLREFGRRVEPPEWCPPLRRDRFVVEVADGVLVVVEPPARRELWPQAVTVLTRGVLSEEGRAERNARARRRRGRKHGLRMEASRRPQPPRHFDRSSLGEQEGV